LTPAPPAHHCAIHSLTEQGFSARREISFKKCGYVRLEDMHVMQLRTGVSAMQRFRW